MNTFIQVDRQRPLNAGKVRESNFELLRILCIFGVVCMHVFSPFSSDAEGISLVYSIIMNGICNTCISVFMLISGYFGLKRTWIKVLKLELVVIFYSVLKFLATALSSNTFVLKDAAKACLPITAAIYWYMTAYMLLLIFSPYIDLLFEKFEKHQIQCLIFTLFVVSSVAPTILRGHVLGEDIGRGLCSMSLIYLIGRYIQMYKINISRKKALVTASVAFAIIFLLNGICTVIKGSYANHFVSPYTSFIVIASISIFFFFKNIHFKSKLINRVAKHVMAVYLLDTTIRLICGMVFDISVYQDYWYFFIVCLIYAVVVVLIGLILDTIRMGLWACFEDKLVKLICCIWAFIFKQMNAVWCKYKDAIVRYYLE